MGNLCKSAELMADAAKRGYGVPAYNTFNYETTKMVLEAAERAGTSVIIMLYPGMGMPADAFADMTKRLGEKKKVPYSLHLDHSSSFEQCMQFIHAGFSSVMIDASKKPFAENVATTRKVVEAAHAMGVDVEGELGMVGRAEAVNRDLFTQPDEAVAYVEQSGVDTLAVAVGNSHGIYIEEPELDIPLIRSIRDAAKVPLVMHGTSMIPIDQLKDAVRAGITKTNIATEYWMYYKEVITKNAVSDNAPKIISALLDSAHESVTEFIAAKMRILNPDNVSIV